MAQPTAIDPLDDLVGKAVGEYFQCLESGQRPQLRKFIERYPEISDLLKTVIPALQAADGSLDASATGGVASQRHKQLGDFRILRQIGRGGMGIVYEAEQISMNRRVALKVLPLAGLVDEMKIRRFQNEVRAVAALDHPNIVSVYTIGEERGVHYFSMQLIRGRSLSEVISSLRRVRDRGERLDRTSISQITSMGGVGDRGEPDLNASREPVDNGSCQDVTSVPAETVAHAESSTIPHSSRREYFRSVVALGIQAASALQHAHEQGIIHRDVKPANLLLDGSAKLYVTDFGLARIEADTGVTMTGDLIGTLRYMAPEQALAKRTIVDHRADIYSLAATLYELLTLQPAYPAADRLALLKQIAFEEPTPSRRIDREIPTELDTIIHKAMSKDVDQRYASAQALADDLRSHLENRPIKAKPPTTPEIIGKWTRRNPILTWATIITLSLVSVTLAASTLLISKQLGIAKKAQELESVARADASSRTHELARRIYLMHLANADRSLLENDYARARLELDSCPQEDRGWEWHYLNRSIRATIRQEYPGAEQPIFSHEGQRITALGALGTPEQRRVSVWEVATGKLIGALEHESRLSHIAMSPDSKWVAGGDHDGNLVVWDAATGKKRWSVREHTARFDGLAFSPDARLIATANVDKTLKLFDSMNGQVLRKFSFTEDYFRKVMFSPDGHWIAAAGANGLEPAMIIDVSTGEIAATFPGEGHMVPTFDPDGHRIATSNLDGSINLWEWDGKQPTASWSRPASSLHVWALDFSADGKRLASGDRANGVKVWNVDTGEELATLETRGGALWLAHDPWRSQVAFFTVSGGIRLWEYGGHEEAETITVTPVESQALARFSPDGQLIAISSPRTSLWVNNDQRAEMNQGGPIKLLDAASGAERLSIGQHLHSACWTPDGQHLVTAADLQGEIRVYHSSTGELAHALPRNTSFPLASFATTGRQLDVVLMDGTIGVRNLESGKDTATFRTGLEAARREPICVSIGPNNDRVGVAFYQEFTIEVWDVQSRSLVRKLPVPGELVSTIVFANDGHVVYASSNSGRLTRLNLESDRDPQRFIGHLNAVGAIALNPKEDQIVSGDGSGRVIVWEVKSAQPLITLTSVGPAITSLDWSSDGCRIVAGKQDGTVQIWTLPSSP